MGSSWKRWTAVVLLAFAAIGASAGVCATVCGGHHAGAAGPSYAGAEPTTTPGDCPLTQICEFAVTPVLLTVGTESEAPSPAFVPALHDPLSTGIDPGPPLKPPVA